MRLGVAIITIVGLGCQSDSEVNSNRNLPAESRQIIVVTTPDWDAREGSLSMLTRGADGEWIVAQHTASVTVGRAGLAWGDSTKADHKIEGDGKAPAGIFPISSAFGYAPTADTKLEYVQATEHLFCVDDINSEHYNRIVSDEQVEKDWSSAETMILKDDRYKWGLVVDYNRPQAVPGRGSCIFLHVWKEPGYPTAGCTAMSEADMLRLLNWIEPGDNPLLVQYPIVEYNDLRSSLALPKLSHD